MNSIYRKYHQQFLVFLIFLFLAFLIVILHLLFHPVRVLGMDTSIFYMDEKYTLAAFFTTITAFLVGYLSLVNAVSSKIKFINKIVNIGYGLFFVILSIDEYFEIHEYINAIIKLGFKEKGKLGALVNFSWVFPLFIIIMAIFTLLLVKIKKTEKEINKPLILGCLSFLVVLLFELLGSATYGQNIYLYFVAVEEGMEMVGISFFFLATIIETRKTLP